MTDTLKALTLAGIADGAAEELFTNALDKVLANLVDPNTDWKKGRRITLTFDFSTDEERRVGDVEIACSAKLAGVKGVNVGIYIGKHEGVLTAVEAPKQEEMFTQTAGRPRAVGTGGAS
jgi:hypothetical protein